MRRFFALAAGLTVAAGSATGMAWLATGPAVAAASAHQATAEAGGHVVPIGALKIVRVPRITGFELVNQAHFLCLIANPSGDGSNGDKVELWTCSTSHPLYQQWTASGPTYHNAAHNLCLDAASSGTSTNGDKVQLWSCSNGAANQEWLTPSSKTELVNQAGAKLCLDAASSDDGGNGDTVQLWACPPTGQKVNQEWHEGN